MGTDTSKSLFDQAMKEILATNFVAAEMLLQQAAEINEEGTTLYAASWAVLLSVRDRMGEAIEILEERLETNSTDPNLLLAYGLVLEKQEKYEDAEDAFREVLTNDEENAGALRGLSACLERKGDVVSACKLAAQAFTLDPENLVLAKNAAHLLEEAGQINTAFEVLLLGAHYNAEDEELVTKAVEQCLQRGQIERAEDLLTQVDVLAPWAAGWKASFLDWQGDEERANHLIQKTLERFTGKDNTFLFHLCCILMRRGEVGAAEAYMEHILNNDPQHPGALRMKADFSIGRFEYNEMIDPLASALATSTEIPGWPKFWHQVRSGSVEEAEESLAIMAEEESFNTDPVELARMEIAEQLILALSEGELVESELHLLDELPTEAAAGILLEFLEVLDGPLTEDHRVEELRALLNDELGLRDPILRLTRFYALGRWDDLGEALESFQEATPAAPPDQQPERELIHRLYTLLLELALGHEEPIEDFDFQEDPDLSGGALDILLQKAVRNAAEQRFLDKLSGESQKLAEREVPELEKTDDGPSFYEAGGLLNARDAEVVLYETEDGQTIEDFNEEEYEIIEEYEEVEVEPDPEDDEYEYVWVEEEVPVEEYEVEVPEESFQPTDPNAPS